MLYQKSATVPFGNIIYLRAGYLAYGIKYYFLTQIFGKCGYEHGLNANQGLTLPFISYGGTSLMMWKL